MADRMSPQQLLIASFKAGIAAADPSLIVPPHLPEPPRGRTLVVGVGKAAAAMAAAVEANWPEPAPLEGLVITRYAHGVPTRRIRVVEAGHPLPDENGESAAGEIFAAVQSLTEDDLLLALISGGGSSLLALPVPGVTLADLKRISADLLRSGAPIQEINTVRKHLSQVQGGRLALACPAPILALIISDVTGDEATHVASGPCAPDPTTFADAIAVLRRYQLTPPAAVMSVLEEGAAGIRAETPKPGDSVFARVDNRIIARAGDMLAAARAFFEARGISARVVDDKATGEARELAVDYAELVRELGGSHHPWLAPLALPPLALISGGECSVSVKGDGRGGPCTEFLLALALELDGMPAIHALAADSDGIDGVESNAGAYLAPDSLVRAKALGLDAAALLEQHDAYTFFEALGDLLLTGPTRTNVNDYRVIYLAD